MSMRFRGREFFVRIEGERFDTLLRGAIADLSELERSTTGRLREKVRSTREVVVPSMEAMGRASSEATLSPRAVKGLRQTFESLLRDGTRAAAPLRATIERVAVRLRVLQARVVAIVHGLAPGELQAYRETLMSGLWDEPGPVRSPSDPDFDWRELPGELHRAWLARLAREWDTLNWYYLDGMLKAPVFELSDSREKLGEWIADRRAIAVSGWHVALHSWQEVVETLKHEMAHQLVAEAWGRGDAAPHGPEFLAACEKLRCGPRGSVDPDGLARAGDSNDPVDRIVSRIRKLLALGQSPNQHEAALAMERASELLTRFNLDASALDRQRKFLRRWVGPTLTRREEHHHNLATILADHFFVRIIWDHSYLPLSDSAGVRMVAIGTRENLDVSEYVHDYLSQSIQQLWNEHRASAAYHGGRKSQFLAGLTRGFLEKLGQQRSKLVKERALVSKGDPGLEAHVAHLYPRLSRSRGGGVSRGEDYHIGVAQGREITLRMGVTERSPDRGVLLPPSRKAAGD
ncbi:MAG: DUF2786 domain-containing protein [Candidatus Riflebacteria bacterium]|nr:DUF2786 domain-containing protein [Candidatus Riflebacteria bacterium]